MPNPNHASSLLPVVSSFLLGVAATFTASFVVSRLNGSQASTTRSRNVVVATADHSNNNNTRQVKDTDILDSPELDLRLIRKAEAVIQWRSGNMTVVIERSTNSWNRK